MSSASFKFNTRAIRAQIREVRENLPVVVATELKQIATASLNQRYVDAITPTLRSGVDFDRGAVHGRLKKLSAVFIPVKLKYERREQWPDLQPIYEAMILRGQHSYQGRSKFWVDENKLAALRRRHVARAARRLSPGDWKVTLRPDWGDIRVTVTKVGRATAADRQRAAHLVSLIEQMFASHASAMLYKAMEG